MVLAHLLKKGGYRFALAHCNYQLRGADSEKDEAFCRKLAGELEVAFYTTRFTLTKKRSAQSLQAEARKLRYDWLKELARKKKYKMVVTAHHANDQAETVLLNLIRGTGLKGMRGIAEKENGLARPLLPFLKSDILGYAAKYAIRFRRDKTNSTDIYRRNTVRRKLIPLLEKINPSVVQTLAENAARFADEYRIFEQSIEASVRKIYKIERGCIRIDIAALIKKPSPATRLHHILSSFGFHFRQAGQILSTIGKPGSRFFSEGWELTVDRKELVLTHIDEPPVLAENFRSQDDLVDYWFRAQSWDGNKLKPDEFVVSFARLVWPVTLRKPEKGDRFHPFGLKGSKLVSDLLREKKVNVRDKRTARVLVNGNGEIMWVPGYRSDERYRVTGQESDIIKLVYVGKN